jgi:predicted nucleic acid-binding protein
MKKIVLDASVVLKWIPGKNEENVEEARKIYSLIVKEKIEAYAPSFLLVEILNILINKRKADKKLTQKAIKELTCGNIRFIDLKASDIDGISAIVHQSKLTSYDAIYLYTAKNKNCKLLTYDKELLKIDALTLDVKTFLNQRE